MFFESITNPNFVFRTMGTVSNQSLSFNVNTYLTVSAWNHIVCTYNGSSKKYKTKKKFFKKNKKNLHTKKNYFNF